MWRLLCMNPDIRWERFHGNYHVICAQNSLFIHFFRLIILPMDDEISSALLQTDTFTEGLKEVFKPFKEQPWYV